jgi:hypothetical protein
MALKKSVTTPQGYQAEYFKISKLWQTKRNVGMQLALYKDQAARNSGKAPVDPNFSVKSILRDDGFSFELTESQFENENVYQCAYNYLKSLPIFSGAEDV